MVKSTKSDREVTIYRLEPTGEGGFLAFMKVDENILLVVDREERPGVGNGEFSYTLNRIVRGEAGGRGE